MSRFKEAILGQHEFAVKYGRPRADLPMDLILELARQGYSCRQIAAELALMGYVTSKTTISRRIAELVKG